MHLSMLSRLGGGGGGGKAWGILRNKSARGWDFWSFAQSQCHLGYWPAWMTENDWRQILPFWKYPEGISRWDKPSHEQKEGEQICFIF